jgi:single-strand DNA-binding protein
MNLQFTLRERSMPALNRIQLIGHLGKDPETRYTPTGKKVCSFTLAVDQKWRSSDGELQESTEWFNIDAWGHTGEICQEYLHKGQLIFVEGRLHTSKYEQQGETRYFTKVIASHMQMLDRPPEAEEPDLEVEEL